MAVAAGVSDSAIASANGQARAKRYWPGKAPDWTRDPDDDHLELPCVATLLDKAFPRPGDRADTAAVRRLADAESRGELRPDQEVVFATDSAYQEEGEVVPAAENEEDKEERRRRILERRLLRQRGDEELLPREENDIMADEDEESEYETDSEEDEAVCIAVVKPVFVQESQRDTVAEKERTMEEKRVKKRTEERKVETRRIVVEVIMKEEKIEKTQSEEAADTMDIDTDDEFNAEDEYEAWKNREVSRIREAREARSREKGEAKKVRTMAEEEHMDLESMDRKPPAELKQGRKFLQKYYHRGAFFQEKPDDGRRTFSPDDIYMRDFSEATGEDKMDKFILPKVMQVKNFGRKGRPKGTHLSNEDTTHWSIPLLEN